MSTQEELYDSLTKFPIDPPSEPPVGSYSLYFDAKKYPVNLIESVFIFERNGYWDIG